MSLLGAIVDGRALLETVIASAVAGLGVTLVFSVALYGAARFADFAREERPLAAGVAAVFAVAGALAFLAVCVLGILVMTQK